MSDVGLDARGAWAWTTWARPISPPSSVTKELSDMFWALNGATETPRRRSQRQSPVTMVLLPAPDEVPRISSEPVAVLIEAVRRSPSSRSLRAMASASRATVEVTGRGEVDAARGEEADDPRDVDAVQPGRARALVDVGDEHEGNFDGDADEVRD